MRKREAERDFLVLMDLCRAYAAPAFDPARVNALLAGADVRALLAGADVRALLATAAGLLLAIATERTQRGEAADIEDVLHEWTREMMT